MTPRNVKDWHSYFLGIANAAGQRSKDPHTQVGCCIVNENNRLVVTGYNGAPPGVPDSNLNWSRPDKYDFILHAELNAIVHARQDLSRCILYVTGHPCTQCMKAIAAAGIKRVVYTPRTFLSVDEEERAKCKKLAEMAGIELLTWEV